MLLDFVPLPERIKNKKVLIKLCKQFSCMWLKYYKIIH
jgi:hypothetical protein